MKKVLVTGANGFVGTNLRKYLEGKGMSCLKLDIANADYTWNELEKIPWGEIGAVVHLAGKAHDLKKVASKQSYFDINVGLTEKIGEAIFSVEGEGIRFIYFSSSKASKDGNAYGRSKFAAEQYLNGRAIVLRPAMIHGPGNKGNLNLLWGIVRRGLPWPLAAFENKRSFTSIGNICAAVEALAGEEVKVRGEGEDRCALTFPVADDEMLSTNRLIELIAEACGRKAKLWRIPKGLMRLAARVGDAPNKTDWANEAAVVKGQASGRGWYGHWNEAGKSGPIEVGLYPPSKMGLYDLHGNVYDVCLDYLAGGNDYAVHFATEPVEDPKGPVRANANKENANEKCRVCRGGTWSDGSLAAIGAKPGANQHETYAGAYMGFRLVTPLPW